MSTSALCDWMARKGAELTKVAVGRDAYGGHMLCATADLAEGEIAVRVPLSAMLTLDVARRSPAGQALLAASSAVPSAQALLTAYLLDEKRRPGSPIAPYLDTLPEAFPTVPVFCPQDVLPLLRGSLAATLLVRRREAILREVLAVRRAVPSLRGASIGELFWANSAVITRVFGVTIAGSPTEALVPIADMMNHRRPPDAIWTYDEALGAFVIRAARAIRAGEEIYGSYGRKANHRYFVHYGFALASGADDEAEVRLSVPEGAQRRGAKIGALGRAFGSGEAYRVSSRVRGDPMLRTFSFLRTACAGNGELARALRLLSDGELVPPLSHRNEAAALALLHGACVEALGRFDSPLGDDDDAQLARPDLPVQARSAVLVRRGEKRLLHACLRLTDTAIPMLRLPRRRFFTEAVFYRGDALTTSYLMDVAMALAPRDARRVPERSVGL
jgi:histone-lysine N-methyltransferase SETD3